MSNSSKKRLSVPFQQTDGVRKYLYVYDCRNRNEERREVLETTGLDFNDFLHHLRQKFKISSDEQFQLITSNRRYLDFDIFEELGNGSTLHLFKDEKQALSAATNEHIDFTPHYNTLICGGAHEYYGTEDQKPLSYIIAELIDNALSATAKNKGERTIEIQMLFDETLGKPAIIVLDNGCGMTSKQLNNWAVYRLSKFSREQEEYVRPDHVPRSLNSDISYFGVGGKHAIFYIGESARMITKVAGFTDVHELVLSKEDFEKKVLNKEDVYSGIIKNRKPGDSSHVTKDERFLHALIAEESGKESFTAVVITGIFPDHITYLKQHFEVWTRQLAHVYHYYIHGVNGNHLKRSKSNHLHEIDIQITLQEKPSRLPRVMKLWEVDNDMETLFINAAEDTFEFNVSTEQNGGTVEGVIRYHPFLFDKETYPKDPSVEQVSSENIDDDNESGVLHQARGKKAIFDCFWNGRLIPFTNVSEFDWCTWSKDSKVPAECYNRISGVLFTNDRFQVSTNKLVFIDLEQKLKSKDTIFTRVVHGQKQRGNIQRTFTQWLQNCHEKLDKQIQFLDYKGTITRTDVPTKKMQYPWGSFSAIEWDGKTYKAGQIVKSQKTLPILYGSVIQFLLYGNYKEDVYATGGLVEVAMEPRALHDKIKTIPISKIDPTATAEAIKKHVDDDFAKLPDELNMEWPDGNRWPLKAVHPAGTVLGPLKIEIRNKKGESLSRMPSVGQGPVKKLIIELKVIQHGAEGDKEVVSLVAQHSAKWGYWFKKIENLTQLGKYTLSLSTVMSESNATVFGGRALPSKKLTFTITEGDAECFLVGAVNSTIPVGVPFDIPLHMKDGYGHPAIPPNNLKPSLTCSGLSLHFEKVDCSGTMLTIRSVKAKGKVLNSNQPKPYELKVTLPGMKKDTQSVNIILLPGKPHSLHVTPDNNPITVENGNCVRFNFEIHDEAGNITANPKQIVRCQIQELRLGATASTSAGAGELKTEPINLKLIKGEPRKLKIQFEMPNQKSIASVVREIKVLPSTRVSQMEVYSRDDENLVLTDSEKIEWLAGSSLENLFYRLFDEAGREVPLTAEIASKIKVNWTREVDLTDVAQGMLPEIQVPRQVHEERFYQVSYDGQSVSVSFSIVPRPDEPRRLKATLPQTSLKLGETLNGTISLELVDRYDNLTKALTSECVNHMNVEAEGLNKSAIDFTWQESNSSVLVSGVQFLSGSPGSRELCFTYRSYVEQVVVKVSPGVPAQLKLVSEPEKPLQVFSDHGIATPFVVQLCDKWGNPSPDQRVVVEFNSSPQTLKVKTSVTSQPVNAEGKAFFTVNSVSGPKGYYQLEFKGLFNMKPIPGPSVNVTIIPDPNKPVSLLVEYDTKAKIPAGGKFPVFRVTVVSEEGSPLTNFNPAAASMWLWQGGPSARSPPSTATELKCSEPMENERNGCFHFRGKDIPERVGKCIIQFSLRIDNTKVLFSNQITLDVVANQPVKLAPDSVPPTPVVSYGKDIARRTLLENLTLRIMDSFGNPAGQNLDGKVTVSVKNSSEHCNNAIPLFEGKTNRIQFNLVKGKIDITRLAVMENSPGVDGSSYILLLEPEVFTLSTPLAPFELPFHFYNDVENQQKMSELSKKKSDLTRDLAVYKETFNTYAELLPLLNAQYQKARGEEAVLRSTLNMKNLKIAESVSIPNIDRLLAEKTAAVDRVQKTARRVCSIRDPFTGQQDVLGMVGHLAFVHDNAAAWVISWHIRSEMDCVITKTTEAARRIYNDTGGMRQVMALDSIFVSAGNRALPHIREGRMLFQPPGNPVFARELLIYTQDQSSCDAVFKNILRDTILIDDLDSANNYRRAVVQRKTPCPTILTRDGNRVNSTGKFGGAQNRAPPMDTLKVFGAPYPQPFYTLKEEIDMLTQYRSTLQKRDSAAEELDNLVQKMQSPETLEKQQEMKEKERQLEEIERQSALTRQRPVKRGPEHAGEPSGIIAKRGRAR